MLIDFREGGMGGKERERRERNISVREKYQLVASHTHSGWGPNPQPRYMP